MIFSPHSDLRRKKLKRKFKDYRKNLVSPEVLEMRQKYTTAKKRSTITSSAAAEAIPPPSPVKRSKVQQIISVITCQYTKASASHCLNWVNGIRILGQCNNAATQQTYYNIQVHQ
jgi:hypothetical protein